MKKIIAALVLLLILPGIGMTQQTENNNTKESKDTVSSWLSYIRRPQVMPISKMDQRKIYKWRNGQKSTATGRQAGDPTALYARVYGDSAMVVSKSSNRKY